MSNDDEFQPIERLRRLLQQQLVSLAYCGVLDLPKPRIGSSPERCIPVPKGNTPIQLSPDMSELDHSRPIATDSPPPVLPNLPMRAGGDQGSLALETYGPSLSTENRADALAVIQSEVAQCRRCNELVHNRTQTVFGVGSHAPRLCFVGEAPGAEEDRQGEPFVGAAGKLLDKIISAAQMRREEVYILNVIKCRPPGNRNPEEREIQNCWGYSQRQLEILQPEFICCLGSIGARAVLDSKESIGRLRGTFYRYRGSQVIVTYHPAYLLRNPSAKRQVWDDMQMLMRAMGIQLPK
jgi:DNA polymerase